MRTFDTAIIPTAALPDPPEFHPNPDHQLANTMTKVREEIEKAGFDEEETEDICSALRPLIWDLVKDKHVTNAKGFLG